MAFSGFNLLGDAGRSYLNTELVNKIGTTLRGGADALIGLAPGGSLRSIIRGGLLGNFGFLVDTVTKERLIFQYNVGARESSGVDYNPQMTLGRSVPHLHYRGGRVRQIDLPITFTMREITRDDVRRNIRWLQGLAYPDYSGDDQVSRAPHPVLLVQGKLYTNDMWVVQDYNIQWGEALDPIFQLPNEATINLSLIEVAVRGKSRQDVIYL